MYKKGCGCNQGCHGRRYLTKEEKKEILIHKQECLEKELKGIKEAIQELNL
jgi:hypothetical protein